MMPRTCSEWMDLWWVKIPVSVNRRSDALSAFLMDGNYLCAWPTAGAFAPLLAMLFGAFVGSHWLIPCGAFSCSWLAMAALVAIGCISSALAVWFIVGYAIPELIIRPRPEFLYPDIWIKRIGVFFTSRLGVLHACLFLGLFIVFIPWFSRHPFKRVSTTTLRQDDRSKALRLQVQVPLQFILMFFWNQSFPVLIRPLWIWDALAAPDTPAIDTVQEQGWGLLIVASLMALLRYVLEHGAESHPEVQKRQQKFAVTVSPFVLPSSSLWRIVMKTSVLVFLLAGMISRWWTGPILFIVLSFMLWVYERFISFPRNAWAMLLNRIPLTLRIAVGAALTYGLVYVLFTYWHPQTDDFWPVMVGVVMGQFIFMVLLPSRTVKS